jgi:hypothetical protein|tara:strand:- start:200 stop:442 length:243 start_codon:yes stop_codon:yes gene_type:complete
MRILSAYIAAPFIAITGYRFSKAWRCEDGTVKNFVYEHLLCTVKANITADTLKAKFKALLIKVGIIKVYKVDIFKMNKGA